MATATKEAKQSGNTITLVLARQEELAMLVKEIKRLITTYAGRTAHWNDVLADIIGSNKEQGMMQKLMTIQSTLRAAPNLAYNQDLQRIAAYLGDEFNFLEDINRLIMSELVFAKEKGTIAAILDEIEKACDLINQRILNIRTAAANVASAL